MTRTLKHFPDTVTLVGSVTFTYAVKLGLSLANVHRYGYWDLPEAEGQQMHLIQVTQPERLGRATLYCCTEEDLV